MRLSLQQLFWRFSILDYWCYIGTLKIVYDETFTVVAGCKRWRNWSSSFSPHWFGCWKLLWVWLCCIVIVFKIFVPFSQFLSVLCKFHVLFHVFQHMIWSLLNATSIRWCIQIKNMQQYIHDWWYIQLSFGDSRNPHRRACFCENLEAEISSLENFE